MAAGGDRAVHLAVTGLVQGVGYRAFVERQARDLHLAGWVRNREDRSVEAVVVGPAAAVAQMIAACRRGPPASKVADVRVTEYAGGRPDGFTVLPTR